MKKSLTEKIILICACVLLMLWSFTLIYPFVWMFLNSFQDIHEFSIDNSFRLPIGGWHYENWKYAFTELSMETPKHAKTVGLMGMLFNSVWYTFLGAFLTLLPAVMFSYAVAKYKFKICKFLYTFSVIIMMIPIYGSMPANVKAFTEWGLTDTPLFLIGGMGVIGGTNWLIMTSFMESLPWTYAEAVFIDGGGHWTVFARIMLPMCMPIILALYVMECIGKWNDYLTPYIYLGEFPTLATGVFQLESSGAKPEYFASVLVSVFPIIVIFILCQKQLMNNVTIGGIKG